MGIARHLVTVVAVLGLGAMLGWSSGCGGSGGDSQFTVFGQGKGGGLFGDDGGSGSLIGDDSGPTGPCQGLACQVHTCSGGGSTTISGTVYDPAAKNPLYDVVVYVPNAPLKDLAPGASCYSCSDLYSGSPVASALTGPDGKFTIQNAPDGDQIPLVIQVGKWRKGPILVQHVAQCADTAVPDRSLTLPRNQGEGSIPSIGISTGGADSLECLLRRVGVDASEYQPGGRIHIFQGDGGATTNPPAPDAVQSMWGPGASALQPFDIVILSCEGHETTGMNQQALYDYAQTMGGRVFASHFHYSWFDSGPFGAASVATWSPGGNDIGSIDGDVVTTLPSGAPFPKGVALKTWLGNVGALQNGLLPITQAKHNADVSAVNVASQSWIVDAKPPSSTQYFSFDTPIGSPADQQCGRVVFSDLHVGSVPGGQPGDYDAAGGVGQGGIVPDACADRDLTPQEKALEFMLFDLSSCLTPNDQPPRPPTPVQ
ncbi:MAG TPA: carboxypeptidase regulatory-like domain-containing protein [Polyangiaceae bacterium]|jgi:hypothetical protein